MRPTMKQLPGLARVLLWDFERGSWPYDLVCLILLILLVFVRPAWLDDPTVPPLRPRLP
jgi:hypothetical protein